MSRDSDASFAYFLASLSIVALVFIVTYMLFKDVDRALLLTILALITYIQADLLEIKHNMYKNSC